MKIFVTKKITVQLSRKASLSQIDNEAIELRLYAKYLKLKKQLDGKTITVL